MLPQKQAEEAIVSNFSETEHEGGKEEEKEEEHSMFSVKSILWHGGSAWDAWFSCASNQVRTSTKLHFQYNFFLKRASFPVLLCCVFRRTYSSFHGFVLQQVAQVLLTLPYSFSQLGMLSGILLQIFYGLVGSWTAYLISVLYIEYRSRKEKENVSFKNHVIQVGFLLKTTTTTDT